MQKTPVQPLGQENPLEKEMVTHSSVLAREIPWTEEPGGLQSMGLQRVGVNLVLFSHSVMSDSLWPHGLQPTRLPCPASPKAFSNSCPLSQWCHPIISSSVVLFSSCLQSFPASGSFAVSWFFASGGQSIRASASASVLPVNIQGLFPLGFSG